MPWRVLPVSIFYYVHARVRVRIDERYDRVLQFSCYLKIQKPIIHVVSALKVHVELKCCQ